MTRAIDGKIFPVGTVDHVIAVSIFLKYIRALSIYFRVVELNIQDKYTHRTPSSSVLATEKEKKLSRI